MPGVSLLRLEHELAIWRRAWKRPILWWRDDDCRSIDPRLDRLLSIRGGLPLTLAVIPDGDMRVLARRLGSESGVSIAQHGVDHTNRLPPGGSRSEFSLDTQQEDENAAVLDGRMRMVEAGLEPLLFVPPWNEADARLMIAIAAAGYRTYSIGIHGRDEAGLAHVGAEVDILRWKGTPHFRGHRRVLGALRRRLEQRRHSGDFNQPVGLLTHHLVHDEAAWTFLAWFLPYSQTRFSWRGVDAVCAPPEALAPEEKVEACRTRA